MVARGWEGEECGISVKGDRASAGEDEKVLGTDGVTAAHHACIQCL